MWRVRPAYFTATLDFSAQAFAPEFVGVITEIIQGLKGNIAAGLGIGGDYAR